MKVLGHIILLWLFTIGPVKAQLDLFEEVVFKETPKGTYTSLENARQHPDQVLGLKLIRKKLTILPAELTQYKSLKELNLSYNKFTMLSPDIGQFMLLEKLLLDKNHLTQLPKEIAQLSKLKVLSVYNNQLADLPKQLVQ